MLAADRLPHPAGRLVLVLVLGALPLARAVRYNLSSGTPSFSTMDAQGRSCRDWHGGGQPGTSDCYAGCMDNRPVLSELGEFGLRILERSVPHTGDHPCRVQASFCKSICHREACPAEYRQCQAALHHVKHMMFDAPGNGDHRHDWTARTAPPGGGHKCNNFARKSVRAYFHDMMSNRLDGSLLSEQHLEMNVGLCRWAQYVNVLSDETGCDPASITMMAGMLGFLACGFDMYHADDAALGRILLNNPYDGEPMSTPARGGGLFNSAGQFDARFDDFAIAASPAAMEQFFYVLNPHINSMDGQCRCGTGPRPWGPDRIDRPRYNPQPAVQCEHTFVKGSGNCDGEIDYSSTASLLAHAMGRVTCAASGVGARAGETMTPGFFVAQDSGVGTVGERFNAAYAELRDNRVNRGDPARRQPHLRLNTDVAAGETNFNVEFAFNEMPTQFLKDMPFNQGSAMRFMHLALHNDQTGARPSRGAGQGSCASVMWMYIPYELAGMHSNRSPSPSVDGSNAGFQPYPARPASPALARFEAIAFHAVDSVSSDWDQCQQHCPLPLRQNRLLSGAATPQLRDWDWHRPDNGTAPLPGATEPQCSSSCRSQSRGWRAV